MERVTVFISCLYEISNLILHQLNIFSITAIIT